MWGVGEGVYCVLGSLGGPSLSLSLYVCVCVCVSMAGSPCALLSSQMCEEEEEGGREAAWESLSLSPSLSLCVSACG